jgi:hypothetical protein
VVDRACEAESTPSGGVAPLLISQSQAEHVGVSRRVYLAEVREGERAGALKVIRRGKLRLVLPGDLVAWLGRSADA